jgi:hypothetical protein
MRRNREIAARKKKEREEAERRRKEQEEEEEQLIRDQEEQLIKDQEKQQLIRDQEKDGGLADRLAAECHVEEGRESADRERDVTSGMAESTPSAAEWGPRETEETPPVLDLDQMMQEMNSDDEEP